MISLANECVVACTDDSRPFHQLIRATLTASGADALLANSDLTIDDRRCLVSFTSRASSAASAMSVASSESDEFIRNDPFLSASDALLCSSSALASRTPKKQPSSNRQQPRPPQQMDGARSDVKCFLDTFCSAAGNGNQGALDTFSKWIAWMSVRPAVFAALAGATRYRDQSLVPSQSPILHWASPTRDMTADMLETSLHATLGVHGGTVDTSGASTCLIRAGMYLALAELKFEAQMSRVMTSATFSTSDADSVDSEVAGQSELTVAALLQHARVCMHQYEQIIFHGSSASSIFNDAMISLAARSAPDGVGIDDMESASDSASAHDSHSLSEWSIASCWFSVHSPPSGSSSLSTSPSLLSAHAIAMRWLHLSARAAAWCLVDPALSSGSASKASDASSLSASHTATAQFAWRRLDFAIRETAPSSSSAIHNQAAESPSLSAGTATSAAIDIFPPHLRSPVLGSLLSYSGHVSVTTPADATFVVTIAHTRAVLHQLRFDRLVEYAQRLLVERRYEDMIRQFAAPLLDAALGGFTHPAVALARKRIKAANAIAAAAAAGGAVGAAFTVSNMSVEESAASEPSQAMHGIDVDSAGLSLNEQQELQQRVQQQQDAMEKEQRCRRAAVWEAMDIAQRTRMLSMFRRAVRFICIILCTFLFFGLPICQYVFIYLHLMNYSCLFIFLHFRRRCTGRIMQSHWQSVWPSCNC